jgi:hypothetical protein
LQATLLGFLPETPNLLPVITIGVEAFERLLRKQLRLNISGTRAAGNVNNHCIGVTPGKETHISRDDGGNSVSA